MRRNPFLVLGGLFIAISATAQDFTMIKGKVDLTMQGKTLLDHVGDCTRNDLCNVLLEAGGTFMGVPPGTIRLVSTQLPHRQKGEEHWLSFKLPPGYQYCRSDITVTSMSPQTGKRPVLSVKSDASGLGVYATTPRLNDGRKSWIDATLTVYGVATDKAAEARAAGQCQPPGKLLVDCHGKCQSVQDK